VKSEQIVLPHTERPHTERILKSMCIWIE